MSAYDLPALHPNPSATEPHVHAVPEPTEHDVAEDLPTFTTCEEFSAYVGELAVTAVRASQQTPNGQAGSSVSTTVPSLFDTAVVAVDNIIGDDPEEHVKAALGLPPSLLHRAMWTWKKLPYTALCRAISLSPGLLQSGESTDSDLDEWSGSIPLSLIPLTQRVLIQALAERQMAARRKYQKLVKIYGLAVRGHGPCLSHIDSHDHGAYDCAPALPRFYHPGRG